MDPTLAHHFILPIKFLLLDLNKPKTHLMLLQKQFLFLKVNPTQQDLGMALLLGRRHVGSGQTAVWTFSTGNLALNTHS